MMNRMVIRYWFCGAIVSLAFILLVSAIFKDSLSPVEWNEALQRYTRLPENPISWRSEGWADTQVGKYGLTKGEDTLAEADSPKFILWGDSHAEALQVPDENKITFVYNRLSGGDPWYGITYGRGGRSVADYYFAMPAYQKVVRNVQGSVILISGLDDVTPYRDSGTHARFTCDPLGFDEESIVPPNWKGRVLGPWIRRLRLEPLYQVYDKLRRYRFRFGVGGIPATNKARSSKHRQCDLGTAWNFLLKKLKEQSKGFLVFIYCPQDTPIVQGAKVRMKTEPDEHLQTFKELCRNAHVGFIDMTKAFNDMYREHGRLPRGFFNSPPGTGHLNAEGQRLIAEALLKFFREREQ